jgi:choice-of-anchor C domain-containing protein
MHKLVLAATAFTLLILGTVSRSEDKSADAKEENLIVNGSFEEGPDVAIFLPLDEGSTDIKGWTVTRGQIDYIGPDCWKAADGKRSLDLHGSPGFGGVKQAIKTKKGQRYRVTFSMAGNFDDPEKREPVKLLCVRAAGKKEAFSFDTTGKTADNMGWLKKAWEFEAVADETTIEFHTLETEADKWGPALDNVRVVAVQDRELKKALGETR